MEFIKMVKISVISDVHIGLKSSKIAKFKKALKDAEKVILLGDIIDGVTKKDKRHGNNDVAMTVDDEILTAQNIIRPYKNKILHYIIGNHEDSLLTYLDIDAVKLIAKPLNIPYSYTEIFTIDKTSIACNHGTGAPITFGGAILQLEKFAKDYVADIYCIGHTHKLFDLMESRHPNKKYQIINTGTFCSGSSYAEMKKFPPSILGYYIIDTVTKEVTRVLI